MAERWSRLAERRGRLPAHPPIAQTVRIGVED
jgi:hypothetical protein